MSYTDVQGGPDHPGAAALPLPRHVALQRQHRGRVERLQRHHPPQGLVHPDAGRQPPGEDRGRGRGRREEDDGAARRVGEGEAGGGEEAKTAATRREEVGGCSREEGGYSTVAISDLCTLRICYGFEGRIRKYGFVSLVTEPHL